MSWDEIQGSAAFGLMVIGLIVIFGPLIAERLRLPGLLGLLVGGALIGPNMLDVLDDFSRLEAIGEIGVLYLIFLAGMQLDIDSFIRHRRVSGGFGVLTATIPFLLGTLVALLFDIDLAASILIGSFWASFTLITYPTLSRYGLTRNRAVAATIGASSITDTISLIILALVIGSETGDASGPRLLVEIAVGLVLLAVWCLGAVPWAARWFFAGLGEERTLRFMFVLVALTSSAVVAELLGIEALLGAFLAGAGLNRIVPNKSPLMRMTDFMGNALFIPTFLISVGLLFDPVVMVEWETVRLALGFSVALIIGKIVAAWATGRLFGFNAVEVGLMSSISVAQAAATLAATIVGLEAGLYGDDVLNAVMVVVALSLILTSVGTERFTLRLPPPEEERRRIGEAVLLPADSSEEELPQAVELAARFTDPVGGVIQPIVIATSSDDSALLAGRDQQALVDRVLRRAGRDVECELRIARSVANGLDRFAVESDSSLQILQYPGRTDVRGRLLGANYREVVAATAVPAVIAAMHKPLMAPEGRVVVFASRGDLVPGRQPSMTFAIQLATTLAGQRHELAIGPLPPEDLTAAGIELPEGVAPTTGDHELAAFGFANTTPGDLLIVAVHDPGLKRAAVGLYESGRSVLIAARNPESQSSANGNTLTFPVGASV